MYLFTDAHATLTLPTLSTHSAGRSSESPWLSAICGPRGTPAASKRRNTTCGEVGLKGTPARTFIHATAKPPSLVGATTGNRSSGTPGAAGSSTLTAIGAPSGTPAALSRCALMSLWPPLISDHTATKVPAFCTVMPGSYWSPATGLNSVSALSGLVLSNRRALMPCRSASLRPAQRAKNPASVLAALPLPTTPATAGSSWRQVEVLLQELT